MVQPQPDPLAYTVPAFCKAVGISPRTFWNLQKVGKGPALTKIGRRVVVRRETAERWLQDREQATAQEGNATSA